MIKINKEQFPHLFWFLKNVHRKLSDIFNSEKVCLKGVYKFTLENIYTGEKKVYVYENLIPTVGRTMIANNLTDSSPDNVMRINYTALGTGTNVPANGDTTLQTETFRKTTASQTNSSNIAYITAFYTAAETSGTFREAGLFSNGTASVDTGVLFSRVAINITKSVSETLTIDYSVTIS